MLRRKGWTMLGGCGLAFALTINPAWSANAPSEPVAAQSKAKTTKTKTKAPSPPSEAQPFPAGRCDPPPRPAPNAAVTSFRDCVDTPEMVRLIGGNFLMGDQTGRGLDYEAPAREVKVGPFAIGKFEVTWDEWQDCVGARVCRQIDDEGWGRARRPVINVSWEETQEYLNWLSRKTRQTYRLPSEAEWEYAARAGTQTIFSWGDAEMSSCDHANVFDWTARIARPNWSWWVGCDDEHANTAPVGSYQPNPWGIHDLQGNVWEWTGDCWHNSYAGAPGDSNAWIDGGDCSKRVNRGGGWGNNPRTLRPSARDADPASSRGDAMGFRVVREME